MDSLVAIVLLIFTFLRTSNALKLPLFFPNSPESPKYVKNLTREQRIEHLLQHSIHRARSLSLERTINFTNLASMVQQELLVKRGSLILLKIGIGTFNTPIPYKSYYLHMDTGSQITWLQCEECQIPPNMCFGTPPILFPNSKSSSYHPIPCDSHESCFEGKCENGFCSYRIKYGDSTRIRGILASETFTFSADPRQGDVTNDVTYNNIVFGCNLFLMGIVTGHEDSGIMGIGWGEISFLSQIKTNTFSYCFPHYDQTALGATGYLKLGSDEDSMVGFSSTAFQHYPPHSHYYLNLEGISVGETRLEINSTIFVRDNQQGGGTLIDSGSYFSTIVDGSEKDGPYSALVQFLKNYFSAIGNHWRIHPGFGDFEFDLCYRYLVRRDGDLPSVTLHFQNADFVLPPQNVFIRLEDTPNSFCLAMRGDKTETLIGAYQQSDFKFIFDRLTMLLHFKRENCHSV